MILVKNATEALSLKEIAKKKGRFPTEESLSSIQKPALLFSEKGKIIFCGPENQLPKKYFSMIKSEISAKHLTLLPGFVECHTHSLFVGSRAHELEWRNQGLSYPEISKQGGGILSSVRALSEASDLSVKKQTFKHIHNFIKQGVTTLEIKTGYGLSPDKELRLLKILSEIKKTSTIQIVPTFLGAHAKDPQAPSWKEHLQNLENYFSKIKKYTQRVDIFIEEGFCPPDLGNAYLISAKKWGFDLCVHADQLSSVGASQIGIELGAKSVDHVIHISDSEIKKLSHSQTTAVLLPTADLYLKCPYPPAQKLLNQGCSVALSTDFNPGTSPTQSLSLVGVLARIEMKMTLPQVITALTYNSAKALGLENEVGSLETNKWANFIFIEGNWRDLFYSADPLPVKKSFFKGKKLF